MGYGTDAWAEGEQMTLDYTYIRKKFHLAVGIICIASVVAWVAGVYDYRNPMLTAIVFFAGLFNLREWRAQ